MYKFFLNEKINDKLLTMLDKSSYIAPELYEKHQVKRGLRNANGTGVIAGITNVASIEGYTVVNGEKIPKEGSLFYRGIDIKNFTDAVKEERRFGYEEAVFLLLFGKLPSKRDLATFEKLLDNNRNLNQDFTIDVLIKTPCQSIMNKLQRAVLAMYSYDNNPEEISLQNNAEQSLNMISKMPIMVAYLYQAYAHYFEDKSMIIHNPLEGKSTSENFLHLIREDGDYLDIEAKLLDLCMIVHADHGGGNNSAFATHVVSSSGTDIYSAISTAIGSLKGPKHGGANKKVMDMFKDIRYNCNYDNVVELEKYIRKILKGEAFDQKGLVYGMGHAVYTLSDPRYGILRDTAKQLSRIRNMEEEYALIENTECITKRIFREEKNKEICANVDMYSGFIYKMMGIPEELYTPIFAMARLAGWCAHRLEQIRDDKIIRPAYVAIYEKKPYVSLDERKNLI